MSYFKPSVQGGCDLWVSKGSIFLSNRFSCNQNDLCCIHRLYINANNCVLEEEKHLQRRGGKVSFVRFSVVRYSLALVCLWVITDIYIFLYFYFIFIFLAEIKVWVDCKYVASIPAGGYSTGLNLNQK